MKDLDIGITPEDLQNMIVTTVVIIVMIFILIIVEIAMMIKPTEN